MKFEIKSERIPPIPNTEYKDIYTKGGIKQEHKYFDTKIKEETFAKIN